MTVRIDIERTAPFAGLPDDARIAGWLTRVLERLRPTSTVALRIVDEDEGGALNARWRGKSGATNVLSFPASGLEAVMPELLGDVVLCAPLAAREAREQHKPLDAHVAHLAVHAVLHLLGYDHQQEEEAERMERLECDLLADLGYPDPYREREPNA